MTEDIPEQMTAREAAEYIAALTQELATLAARNRLDMLRYLLEMACMEARDMARSEMGARRSGRRGARPADAL